MSDGTGGEGRGDRGGCETVVDAKHGYWLSAGR
jgi:hypothetical protein